MLNKVILMGRPVHTPEVKTAQSGISVARLRLACDRDVQGKDGTKADFIDVTAFRGTADFIGKYVEKGRMVLVEGRLQIEDYNDKEGNRRTRPVIMADRVYFADSPKKEPFLDAPPPEIKPETRAYGEHLVESLKQPPLQAVEADDDDLPF